VRVGSHPPGRTGSRPGHPLALLPVRRRFQHPTTTPRPAPRALSHPCFTVRNYLRSSRQLRTTPPPAPAPPKIRDLTSWILRHPDSLDADEQLKLKEVLNRCLDLDAAAGHVASFAEIMSERRGDHLGEWIAKVEADQLPDLHSFTAGLRHDLAAVVIGDRPDHSSRGYVQHFRRAA
jgi:hypothetical protein